MTTEELKFLESRFNKLEKQNEMILIYLAANITREQYVDIKKAVDKLNTRRFHRALDIEKIKEMFKH